MTKFVAYHLSVFAVILGLACHSPLHAQEKETASKKQNKAGKEAEGSAKGSPKTADKESPDSATKADAGKSDAAKPNVAKPDVDIEALTKRFDAKLQDWKDVIKRMRTIQGKYIVANQEESGVLESQWYKEVEVGRALIPQVRDLGMKLYAATPNDDISLVRFLIKVLGDDISRDRLDEALELANLLIDNECGARVIYSAAGVAAFRVNDFDQAETHFKKAVELRSLDEVGRRTLSALGQMKELWAKEKEILAKEAAEDDLPRVLLSTSQGDIVVELFENEAPQTVANYISLVEKGFYDGLTFHRVLGGEIAQGGCPDGTGQGGPKYNIYCECRKPDFRRHFRGYLSMAHSGRDTGGSQFFITFLPRRDLDGLHTVFGRVIQGHEVLAKLQRIDPKERNAKVKPDIIKKATVIRKREHKYVPTPVED